MWDIQFKYIHDLWKAGVLLLASLRMFWKLRRCKMGDGCPIVSPTAMKQGSESDRYKGAEIWVVGVDRSTLSRAHARPFAARYTGIINSACIVFCTVVRACTMFLVRCWTPPLPKSDWSSEIALVKAKLVFPRMRGQKPNNYDMQNTSPPPLPPLEYNLR